MNVRISPRVLKGMLTAPFSKSDAHRVLIAAALCNEPTEVVCSDASDDIRATLRCLSALGANVRARDETRMQMVPMHLPKAGEKAELDCGESGTTLRFLLPIAAALGMDAVFSGHGRLPSRPREDLIGALRENGSLIAEGWPVQLSGKLQAGVYRIRGDISSQYLSGLLYALPLLDGSSTVELTTKLESLPYVEMTRKTLATFGVHALETDGGFAVDGGQRYLSPGSQVVEGDWSSAAFFLSAGALGGGVTVTGLLRQSLQGDRAILDLLERFGANLALSEYAVTVEAGELKGQTIDVSNVPDLFPILAVVASVSSGTTKLTKAKRLRIKESDRIRATAEMLRNLGAEAEEQEDALVIRGKEVLEGGEVDSYFDHRIAMAAAVASIRCKHPVVIRHAEAVEKSYPHFFKDFKTMGGNVDVIYAG